MRVIGTVQGVGFRPFVYRLAGELGLTGYVLNDDRGVLLEAEGAAAAVGRFLERLSSEAPPLATVEQVSPEELAPTGGQGFEIAASERSVTPLALVSPDVATCPACLLEIADPGNRRYRYPFTNCTDCGPRFTIVRDVPYDRPLTTMSGFEMCVPCRAEYEDPADRRFHAQPNACPECGPRLALLDPSGERVGRDDPLAAAARALRGGALVAIKGLGGYHLACRAGHEGATAALRSRKHREDKPFALMAANLSVARTLVQLTGEEERLLVGRERPRASDRDRAPARGRAGGGLGGPGLAGSGCDAALHPVAPPAAVRGPDGPRDDQRQRLRRADRLRRRRRPRPPGPDRRPGAHPRPADPRARRDSVVRSLGPMRDAPLMLRRSRGYAPASIALPGKSPRPLLACGAELKSTFCIAHGGRAWVSHHIGDLKNYETLRSFEQGVEHFSACLP